MTLCLQSQYLRGRNRRLYVSMNLRPVWAPEPCLIKRKRKTFEDELIKSQQWQTVEGRLLAAPSPSFKASHCTCGLCCLCSVPTPTSSHWRPASANSITSIGTMAWRGFSNVLVETGPSPLTGSQTSTAGRRIAEVLCLYGTSFMVPGAWDHHPMPPCSSW